MARCSATADFHEASGNMKRGNFKTFVDLISPLSETYGSFSVFVKLFDSGKSYGSSPIKEMLPLYSIETNETDQKEVCLMVSGLGEIKEHESPPPLNVDTLIKKISAIRETCRDHIIVLAEKDIDFTEGDIEGEHGDYVMLHLPAAEIKTASDDDDKIFYLMILAFDEEYEHVHYGNIHSPDSEGLLYKNENNE